MSIEKARLLIRVSNQINDESDRKALLALADEILAKKENVAAINNSVQVKFPIQIFRRYKGKPAYKFQELKSPWEEGSLDFAIKSRGSLFAYDRETDEHFLLFHCDNKYEGPSVLAKVDSWLLVGLRGEGLVAIDLEDYYLKRFNSFRETVGKINVTDSEIIIDDGRHRIPLPIERSGEKIRPFYFGPRSAK